MKYTTPRSDVTSFDESCRVELRQEFLNRFGDVIGHDVIGCDMLC